jgi:hypothetical protein
MLAKRIPTAAAPVSSGSFRFVVYLIGSFVRAAAVAPSVLRSVLSRAICSRPGVRPCVDAALLDPDSHH